MGTWWVQIKSRITPKHPTLKLFFPSPLPHSYDILGAGMLWKPKEARILTNFIDQPVNIGKHSRTRMF
jgi:hypothetical protein